MEKLEKRLARQQKEGGESTTDLFLRWGNKKRLRCVRVKDPDDNTAGPSFAVSGRRRIRRKINSHFVSFTSDNNNNNNNDIHEPPSSFPPPPPPPTRLTRNSEAATTLRSESNRKSSSEKGHAAAGVVEKPKISAVDGGAGGVNESSNSKSKHVWPKLYIALTSKEKEEDFMAMKGCKPSHRPKKRPKIIQRTLLLVSPGAWLTDMCQERYEVREKKSTKKRPTGLKAMGNMESDSE